MKIAIFILFNLVFFTNAEERAIKPIQWNTGNGRVSYVRWGSSKCPEGAKVVYSGVVAGSHYTHIGAAVDPLCLPNSTRAQHLAFQSGYQSRALLYGAEYETGTGLLSHAHNGNVPCAVCQVNGYSTKLMIPSHYKCPSGWRREYYGYLMAGYHGHNAATQFTCIDVSLERIQGSGANTNGYLFYTVEAVCDHHIPCGDKELTCVVCTN